MREDENTVKATIQNLGIRGCIFETSFLQTLDILKNCFKGRKKSTQVAQALRIVCSSKLWSEIKFCPSSSLLKKLRYMCTVGFCDQAFSWSLSCGWTKELCSQQPSLVGDWSRVLGSAQLVSHVFRNRASKGEIAL